MALNATSVHRKLSTPTFFFGVHSWVLILFAITLVIIFILCLVVSHLRRRLKPPGIRHRPLKLAGSQCRAIQRLFRTSPSLDSRLLSPSMRASIAEAGLGRYCAGNGAEFALDLDAIARRLVEISDPKCGNCYALSEIGAATNGFSDGNAMAAGASGIVYRGVLGDNTAVAVRKLMESCEVEELRAQVRRFGHAKHKNLVNFLGHSTEGDQRLLVYEYVANGNLHQWLHGCTGHASPLTWSRRMNIIMGIAKGLAYLHEDIEPKIVHQNLKSNNILLDQQWNPKIADFGIANLFPNKESEAITAARPSGYVAPEYDSSGVFTVKSDVYSFGVLVIEIISGRIPADFTQSQVYLLDWLKSMIEQQEMDQVLDPKLCDNPCHNPPTLKELKRVLLLALRCADLDAGCRPAMGEVIHMLEPRDLLLLSGDHQVRRAMSYLSEQYN